MAQQESSALIIRPPTFSSAKATAQAQAFQAPTIEWLSTTWHVVESTLPMWKSKRNVRIQYTPLEPSSSSIEKSNTDKIDDLVSYQSLNNDKVSTVHGVDTAANPDSRSEWDWRGKGWLKIASSHWEVLAWGTDCENNSRFVVTIFAKTMFTPAGLDIYCDSAKGISTTQLEQIKTGLQQTGDADVASMASTLFEIPRDDSRKD